MRLSDTSLSLSLFSLIIVILFDVCVFYFNFSLSVFRMKKLRILLLSNYLNNIRTKSSFYTKVTSKDHASREPYFPSKISLLTAICLLWNRWQQESCLSFIYCIRYNNRNIRHTFYKGRYRILLKKYCKTPHIRYMNLFCRMYGSWSKWEVCV